MHIDAMVQSLIHTSCISFPSTDTSSFWRKIKSLYWIVLISEMQIDIGRDDSWDVRWAKSDYWEPPPPQIATNVYLRSSSRLEVELSNSNSELRSFSRVKLSTFQLEAWFLKNFPLTLFLFNYGAFLGRYQCTVRYIYIYMDLVESS